MKYPKTYNPHKRNNLGIDETRWTSDELRYLANNPWTFTEKIDGMNLRVIYTPSNEEIEIFGRTNKANLPQDLINNVLAMFGNQNDLLKSNFTNYPVIFFGEGCGPGIQKGGNIYSPQKTFIGFDIYCNGYWWDIENAYSFYNELEIPTAPIILANETIFDAIEYVREQPQSTFGERTMEGLVGIPQVQLFNRFGERVKVKIKCCDYK